MQTYSAAAAPSTAASVAAQPHTVRYLERKLAGLQFLTFAALMQTACRIGRTANEGARLDAAQLARVRAAARLLWERATPNASGARAF